MAQLPQYSGWEPTFPEQIIHQVLHDETSVHMLHNQFILLNNYNISIIVCYLNVFFISYIIEEQ